MYFCNLASVDMHLSMPKQAHLILFVQKWTACTDSCQKKGINNPAPRLSLWNCLIKCSSPTCNSIFKHTKLLMPLLVNYCEATSEKPSIIKASSIWWCCSCMSAVRFATTTEGSIAWFCTLGKIGLALGFAYLHVHHIEWETIMLMSFLWAMSELLFECLLDIPNMVCAANGFIAGSSSTGCCPSQGDKINHLDSILWWPPVILS